MKTISQYFKDNLTKNGREYKNQIDVYSSMYLGTENNNDIITQDNMNIIAKDVNLEEEPTYTITDDNLYQIKLITKGELLSTLMKELDFETTLNLNIGSVVRYKFGLKIEETDEYEYLDYDKFIIYKKEYNEDTQRFTYTCYDYMLKSMILLDDNFKLSYKNYQFAQKLSDGQQIIQYYMNTSDIIKMICDIIGYNIDIVEAEYFPYKPYLWHYIWNMNPSASVISNDFYVISQRNLRQNVWYDDNANMESIISKCKTYRDVLDLICKFLGINMYIKDDELRFKGVEGHEDKEEITSYDCSNPKIADTIDESFLKDKNIKFGKMYGPINAVSSYWSEDVNGYAEDSQSVTDNGITLITTENYIPTEYRATSSTQTIADTLLLTLDGTSYNTYDISTVGILYLEWLDYFNIVARGNTYKCLLLNSEITIKNGITEKMYTAMKQEQPEQYVASNKSENDYVADTIRARKSAYANGEKLIGESNITYSTEEIKCGKWIDNKPIYRKVYYNPSYSQSASTTQDISFSLPDMNEITNIYGSANVNNTWYPLPNVMWANANGMQYSWNISAFTSTGFKINTGSNNPLSNIKIYLIIEYTKATD